MSAAPYSPIRPTRTDPDTSGFWEAAERGELAIRRCNDCRAAIHLPKAYCHRCRSWNTDWDTVGPTGTIYSFSHVEHTLHPDYPAPYAVILVELDEAPGVRLLGMLKGRHDIHIGQAVTAWFDRADEGGAVPQWRL